MIYVSTDPEGVTRSRISDPAPPQLRCRSHVDFFGPREGAGHTLPLSMPLFCVPSDASIDGNLQLFIYFLPISSGSCFIGANQVKYLRRITTSLAVLMPVPQFGFVEGYQFDDMSSYMLMHKPPAL